MSWPYVNVLFAASMAGWLCHSKEDDMRWTGAADKRLFRAMTAARPRLLAGRRTFEMMRGLRLDMGRTVEPVDVSSLPAVAAAEPGLWLIGGPRTVKAAAEAGLVRWLYVNVVRGAPGPAPSAGAFHLDDLMGLFCDEPVVRPPSHDLVGLRVHLSKAWKLKEDQHAGR